MSIGAKIGTKSIVAEGAVIKRNQVVPENSVVAGNPAKVVRELEAKDVEMWTWGKQLYVDLAAKYLKIGMQKIK